MRGRDDDSGEFHSQSRSAQRRAALDMLALAHVLVGKSVPELEKLPMDDDLRAHIRDAARITSAIARMHGGRTTAASVNGTTEIGLVVMKTVA